MTGETIVVALLMAGLGGGCLLLTLLTLPGNWAILILVGAAQLWSLSGDGAPLYSGWTRVALFMLAILGEVCETAMGAAGARVGGADIVFTTRPYRWHLRAVVQLMCRLDSGIGRRTAGELLV